MQSIQIMKTNIHLFPSQIMKPLFPMLMLVNGGYIDNVVCYYEVNYCCNLGSIVVLERRHQVETELWFSS